MDLPHIATVDPHAGHPVAGGAYRDVLDGERALHREALRVLVVLAHVDHRKLPDRGQVERLVEGALIGRAVAEERDRELVRAELLCGERGAGRDRDPPADDAVCAEVALGRVGDVHRPAPSTAVPRLSSQELGEHLPEVRSFRDAVTVSAVRACDPVVVAQVRAHACGDRLFPGVAMDRPPDLVLAEKLRRSLLERTDGPHHPVELQGGRAIDRHVPACGWSITRMAPSRRSTNVRHASSNRSSGK